MNPAQLTTEAPAPERQIEAAGSWDELFHIN